MSRRLLAVVLLAVLAVAVPARADEPKFEYGKTEDADELAKLKAVEWKVSAQAGVIITSGNSRTTTAAAGASASRRVGGNRFSLDANGAYARSVLRVANDRNMDGNIDPGEFDTVEATTTKFWLVRGRYDRFLTKHNSIFVAARIGADEPAGKKLTGGGQAGYSRQLVKTAIHELVAEVGYDFTHESFEAGGDDLEIHSARFFAGYRGTLSDATGFEAAFESLLNINAEDSPTGERIDPLQDARINARVALTTRLSTKLSFRFSFQTRFDNVPAPLPPGSLPYDPTFVPLADEIDTVTEAALIVNIL
jgi:hypothetical protein